jgi:ribulose-5-phosphate 4-epimerase/fuculose-1-phosphate aldolase
MTATTDRTRELFGDRKIAPPLPDLSPAAELALLARMLHREGYDDHLAGHITYKQPDGTFLVNPFGLTWDELRASDVMHMDAEGKLLDGPWTITPAITLHVELHRARHDVGVAVHNHPRWATIWADLQRAPEVYDQTGAQYPGKVALSDDYSGSVDQVENARAAVDAIGDADVALLANHGILVLAPSPAIAFLWASSYEWRCRQAWHVEAIGKGVPLRPEVQESFGSYFTDNPFPGLFEAMARREIRVDPTVLD